jgi:rhodanese-related sulfurtransferase
MPNADELVTDARQHLQRLTPRAAADALEWRLDPAGEHSIPEAADRSSVVVFCAQGYASSFAARSLQRLGWRDATDVVGGFDAWVADGLPVRPCAGPTAEESTSTGEEAFDQAG